MDGFREMEVHNKNIIKKTVGLLMATIIIGSMLVSNVFVVNIQWPQKNRSNY